jgi:phosphatidate cytidylyltransferase
MLDKRPLAMTALQDKRAALRVRILSILVLAPIILVLLNYGGYAWMAVVLVVGILAGREFFLLAEQMGNRPSMLLGLLGVELFILEGFSPAAEVLRPLLAGLLAVTLIWALFQDRESAFADWALTMAGAAYVGGLLAHFVALRGLPDGLSWLLLGLIAVWVGDGCAYLVGLTAGRRKLWPRLSPKKTWAGTIGGFLGTFATVLVFVAICRRWFPHVVVAPMGWLPAAVLGVLLGPLALGGDLVVSMFKRRAGAKDSGNLIPGHGGMLDRTDSLLLTIPLVYYWALFVV